MADETNKLAEAATELNSIIEEYKQLLVENNNLKNDLNYYKEQYGLLKDIEKSSKQEYRKLIRTKFLNIQGVEGAFDALLCDYKCVCEELRKLDPQNPLGAGRRITISDKQVDVIKELNKRGGLSAAGIGHQVKLSPEIVRSIIKCDLEQMQPVYSVDDFIE